MVSACPKCGEKQWMTGLHVVDPGDAMICVSRPGLVSPARGSSMLRACSCGYCGYTEFYAINPAAVRDEWRAQHPDQAKE